MGSITAWAQARFGGRIAPNGRPVWQNFADWFGGSKAVNDNGEPMLGYHGTQWKPTAVNAAFRPAQHGIFFADSPDAASGFYWRLITGYLRMMNPYYADMEGANIYGSFVGQPSRAPLPSLRSITATAKDRGHDGVIVERILPIMDRSALEDYERGKDLAATWLIAFDPSQIKSATANNGDFSMRTPSILL